MWLGINIFSLVSPYFICLVPYITIQVEKFEKDYFESHQQDKKDDNKEDSEDDSKEDEEEEKKEDKGSKNN